MAFTIPVKIECGEKTCASSPGVFCKYFGYKGLGTRLHCLFFNTRLYTEHGWVQRAASCLEIEKQIAKESALKGSN